MEYGAIVWDPFTIRDIIKLKQVQRQAAMFITSDYKSRDKGGVTNILARRQLEGLEERHTSQRLIFLYNVVEGLAPAMKTEDKLKPVRQKPLIGS